MPAEEMQSIGGDPASLLLEQLALALETRTPLLEVIEALSNDFGDRKTKRRLKMVAKQLRTSKEQQEPIEILAKLLPARLEPFLRLGVKSGKLPVVLHSLAKHEAKSNATKRKLWGILAYPALIVVLFSCIPLLFSWLLAGAFRELFDEFGLELPLISHAILDLLDWTPMLFKGFAILLAAIVMFMSYSPNIRWIHWLRTATPLFGRAWIWAAHEQFASQMAAMTRIDVPIDDALVATAAWLPDRHLSSVTYRVARACHNGAPLGRTMNESRHFEKYLSALVAVGESSGDLPKTFEEASIEYQQQLAQFTLFLSRVVPPVLAIIIGGFVATSVVALMIPLVSLIENLS